MKGTHEGDQPATKRPKTAGTLEQLVRSLAEDTIPRAKRLRDDADGLRLQATQLRTQATQLRTQATQLRTQAEQFREEKLEDRAEKLEDRAEKSALHLRPAFLQARESPRRCHNIRI
jgi:phage shock protein A